MRRGPICAAVIVLACGRAGAADGGRMRDHLLRDDFADGRIGNQWKASGNWRIVDDPASPGNPVLFSDSNGAVSTLYSQEMLGDFDMTFRARFDTPHKPYPNNDNVHWPHWEVHFRKSDRGGLGYVDSFIWNGQHFTGPGGILVNGPRVTRPARWHTFRITASRNVFRTFVDGVRRVEHKVDDVRPGAIGFLVMHERVWIDDVVVNARPEALVRDTFADGLRGDVWSPSVGWRVRGGENRYVSAPANGTARLSTQLALGDCIVEVRARCGAGGEQARWGIARRDGAGFCVRIGAERVERGRLRDTWSSEGAALGRARGAGDGAWHHYLFEMTADAMRVSMDGDEIASRRVPAAAPGPLTIWTERGDVSIDDVVITPLHQPAFTVAPLEPGGTFLVTEKVGLAVDLENDDARPHTYSGRLRIGRGRGAVDSRSRFEVRAEPGARARRRTLIVGIAGPGSYTMELELACDGRVFHRAEIPATVLPPAPEFDRLYESKFGINGVGPGASAELHFKAGLAWVRTGAAFDGVKRRDDGAWDFARAHEHIDGLRARGPVRLSNLYMLTGRGHERAGIDEIRDTFAAVAREFAGTTKYYQVWNEPNHPGFWRLSPIYAPDYTVVLKESYNAIAGADRAARVLGNNTAGADESFLREVCEHGGADYMDLLGYHPYGYPKIPEDIFLGGARRMKAVVDAYGGWLDHLITECGYVTSNTSRGISEDRQARYLVRTQLLGDSLPHVRAVNTYTFGDGVDPDDNEHRFGIVHRDLSAKPAYVGLATMTRKLANTTYAGRLPSPADTRVHVYRRFDGEPVVVAWSTLDDSFENWDVAENWRIDPDDRARGNHVARANSTALGLAKLTTKRRDIGACTIEFRAMYRTPHKGRADGGPDGTHFPHWMLIMGESGDNVVKVMDSCAWDALLVYEGPKELAKLPGTRPRTRWLTYRVERTADNVSVSLDGRKVLSARSKPPLDGPITFAVWQEELSVDDVVIRDDRGVVLRDDFEEPRSRTVEIPAGRARLEISSMYGVARPERSSGALALELDGAPRYVTGDIDRRIILAAARHHSEEASARLQSVCAQERMRGTAGSLAGRFAKIDRDVGRLLSGRRAMRQASGLEAKIEQALALAREAVDLLDSRSLGRDEVGAITEAAFRYAESLGCALMTMYGSVDAPAPRGGRDALAAAEDERARRRGRNGSCVIAQRMARTATRLVERADIAAERHPAMARVYDVLGRGTARLAERMARSEPVFYRRTLFDVLPKVVTIKRGDSKTLTTVFTNGGARRIDGRITLSYPDAVRGRTESVERAVEVDEEWVDALRLRVPAACVPGTYRVVARFFDGDVKLRHQSITLTVE